MAHRQQFFNGIDHGHAMAARFQHAGHDGDREFFTATNQRCIDAVRALAEKADAVQDMFNLREFLFNKRLQLRMREARQRFCQALQ